jgi:HSP20 family protein
LLRARALAHTVHNLGCRNHPGRTPMRMFGTGSVQVADEESPMTQLSKRPFDPFAEMNDMMHRMTQLMPFSAQVPAFGREGWSPSADLSETAEAFEVHADLPGVSLSDVKVGFEDGMLTVAGEKKTEREEKHQRFHRIERSSGSFSRSFYIPTAVEDGKISALFKDGVLTVKLPKKQPGLSAKKSVDVKAG